jgi:hypothetical protein
MKLSAAELRRFDDEGCLFFPDCHSGEEIALLRAVSYRITKFNRPEWIAHRDFTPIVPVADDALIDYARARRVAAE